MPRRVLLITYYFPPSGGPGVQRALKFAKYLPDFGWQPSVLTVRAGAYPERDATLADDLPQEVAIHRTRTLEPFRWYDRFVGSDDDKAVVGSVGDHEADWKKKLALWIRANVFLPDARVGWVPFAVQKGLRLLDRHAFEAVLTSGPPHSVHLTGRLLHALTGVLWAADFRDPWTDINYYEELPHSWWARRLDQTLEQNVLRNAALVTTVSPHWKQRLQAKVPASAARFEVVHNGFDADDFAAEPPVGSEDHFEISYVGSLYASRNPTALWKALCQLQREEALPRIRVRLVGRVAPEVRQSIRKHNLEKYVAFEGYVPHRDAVRIMQRSTMLLLVIEDFPAAAGMITGKLYEYLAAERPVLGIGPPEGDAAQLLQELEAGRLFGRHDAGGIARFLQRQYEAWADGQSPKGARQEEVASYSRRAQTGHLAKLLDGVL